MGNSERTKLKSYSQLLQFISLAKLPQYLHHYRQLPSDLLNNASIVSPDDDIRKMYTKIFNEMSSMNNYEPKRLLIQNEQTNRCIASLLGLGICDALGASTEFLGYDKGGYGIIKQGFQDVVKAIECELLQPRSGTVGIWTDDCSMALCIATSVILNKGKFVPKHIRYLFILWLFNGLNNGGRQHSIGLGGNIKISMQQFLKQPSDFCDPGDRFNNGNGSLMRLAPIAITYRKNIEQAMVYSALSSRTTHNGEQAQQCCKLLTFILIKLYQRQQIERPKTVLQQACNLFISECESVHYLSRSMQQPEQTYQSYCKKYGKKFVKFNKSVQDRNWNWQAQDFDYSKTRKQHQPDYIGSYCMDALAMALHTIWKTSSFKEVAILNANLGGDCDTVGAIAGQIAGAMYGIDKDMVRLYSQMMDFKNKSYDLFLQGYKIAKI